jgi:hypothetical protein
MATTKHARNECPVTVSANDMVYVLILIMYKHCAIGVPGSKAKLSESRYHGHDANYCHWFIVCEGWVRAVVSCLMSKVRSMMCRLGGE